MKKCDDEHPPSAMRRDSVIRRRDGKPWEAGDVQTGAQKSILDERSFLEVYEGSGLGDGLLKKYVPHGQVGQAA